MVRFDKRLPSSLISTATHAQRVLDKQTTWAPLPPDVETELDSHFNAPAALFDQYKWAVRLQVMHIFLERTQIGQRSALDLSPEARI